MLTPAELTDCHQKLTEARALVGAVVDTYAAASESSLLISEILAALADEVAELERKIEAGEAEA
jgi:hypothetical protein